MRVEDVEMKNPTDLEEGRETRLLFIAGNPAFRPVVLRFLKRYDELSLVGSVLESQKVLAQALYLRPQVILLDLDTWGGWVTGGTAPKMADTMAGNAIVQRLTPMCVVQFNQDPLKNQKLTELKAKSSWQQRDYVATQGWATMPGEAKPDNQVAGECAKLLVQINQ
jgi:hypothetical protein